MPSCSSSWRRWDRRVPVLTRISPGPAGNTSPLPHIFPVPQKANVLCQHGNVYVVKKFQEINFLIAGFCSVVNEVYPFWDVTQC